VVGTERKERVSPASTPFFFYTPIKCFFILFFLPAGVPPKHRFGRERVPQHPSGGLEAGVDDNQHHLRTQLSFSGEHSQSVFNLFDVCVFVIGQCLWSSRFLSKPAPLHLPSLAGPQPRRSPQQGSRSGDAGQPCAVRTACSDVHYSRVLDQRGLLSSVEGHVAQVVMVT
jgi:hypothetical protein